MKPLSIYVHFPFCVQRCRYCDFVSYPWNGRASHLEYLALLQEELVLKVEAYGLKGRKIDTVYFGGGSPSLLEVEDLGRLLESLDTFFTFSPDVEVTLEFKPGVTELLKIDDLRKVGINRLSIGIQSFDSRNLHFLGRNTPVGVMVQVVEKVRELYSRWNIDLIYSLPLQDLSVWKRDLEKALSFQPPHLAVYNLTLHPPAPLYWFRKVHPRFFPSPEAETVLWEWAVVRLQAEGYRHYEISNFAKPGYECRHNLGYWSNHEYLGLGVSAWSYLGEIRERNTNFLRNYVRRLKENDLPVVLREKLSLSRKLGEAIMLGLRKEEGFSLEELAHYPPKVAEEKLRTLMRLVREGWLIENQGRFSFSPRGLLLANQVLTEIVD